MKSAQVGGFVGGETLPRPEQLHPDLRAHVDRACLIPGRGVYVYGWIVTVHVLDGLTGWVLGIREGERVGSYPLSWVFKL